MQSKVGPMCRDIVSRTLRYWAFFIGAISGTVDSIKSISNMVKNGHVEDLAGKKFDQVFYFSFDVFNGGRDELIRISR